MASSIKLGAICVNTHLPHGSIYYIVLKRFTCGVIKCCRPVVCSLNICVYAPLILGTGISVDSAPALQAFWCETYRIMIIQSLFYLYKVSAGHYQCYDKFKTIGPLVLICVEINWPGNWFAMAVLDCRSLVLVLIIGIRWRNLNCLHSAEIFEMFV